MIAAPIAPDELTAWLRLLETPGIGRLSARRLLAAFGSPEEVFRAAQAAWTSVVGEAKAAQLAKPPGGLEALIERTWQWLQAGPARAVLTLGDAAYPTALLVLPDPPLLLYAEGDLHWLHQPAVSVVGSRNPSTQGTENARAFARGLSDAGYAIVSGLALGIDGAAHNGALDGPSGTIAVVGTGLDVTYPSRHATLARRIMGQGVVISEFPLGAPPKAEHFPQRNRVIAALGLGTLVVEAALQSGSLITARLANECGREVFALPGSIHSPQSRGCHALIKQGAKLVDCTQDILDELPLRGSTTATTLEPEPLTAPIGDTSTDPVLQALGHGPATLDTLLLRTGHSAAELQVRLLNLELAGQVERLPGQVFQRLVRA